MSTPKPAVLLAAAAIVVGAGVGVAIVVSNDSGGTTVTRVVVRPPTTVTQTTTTTTPAPTPTTTPAQSLQTAKQTVNQQGYDVIDDSGYKPANTLHMLIGNLSASATGHVQKAFFFVGGRYLGTDSTKPSNGIRLDFQLDDTVALQYALYRPDNPECCPTGGSATVRYHWDGAKLTPLDPIPASGYKAPLSRR